MRWLLHIDADELFLPTRTVGGVGGLKCVGGVFNSVRDHFSSLDAAGLFCLSLCLTFLSFILSFSLFFYLACTCVFSSLVSSVLFFRSLVPFLTLPYDTLCFIYVHFNSRLQRFNLSTPAKICATKRVADFLLI